MIEPGDMQDFHDGLVKQEMPEPIEMFTIGIYTIYVFEKNPLYEKRIKAKASKKKRIIAPQ